MTLSHVLRFLALFGGGTAVLVLFALGLDRLDRRLQRYLWNHPVVADRLLKLSVGLAVAALVVVLATVGTVLWKMTA